MQRRKLRQVQYSERRVYLFRVLDVVEELREVHDPLLPASMCPPRPDDCMQRVRDAMDGVRGRRIRRDL